MLPVSDRPECWNALQVATGIADRLDASIVGCHLRPYQAGDSSYKSHGLPLLGSPDRKWLDELSGKSAASITRKAEKTFANMVGEAGFTLANQPSLKSSKRAYWREKVGVPDQLMAIEGPVADLTVVSRPASKSRVGRLFMLAALLNSGRPVLILPPAQTRAPGKRIAIAWNQSPEAARVVSACMPLLQAADQVTVISCGPESRLGPKAVQLKGYLRTYGVDAKVITTRGREEERELMGVYKDSRSDLLLMGAYSRARFRELVFGGMTEYMLTAAKLPVIMQHT
jgi:hypothetical protein